MFDVEGSALTFFLILSLVFSFHVYFLCWRVNALFVLAVYTVFFFKVRVEDDRVSFLGFVMCGVFLRMELR